MLINITMNAFKQRLIEFYRSALKVYYLMLKLTSNVEIGNLYDNISLYENLDYCDMSYFDKIYGINPRLIKLYRQKGKNNTDTVFIKLVKMSNTVHDEHLEIFKKRIEKWDFKGKSPICMEISKKTTKLNYNRVDLTYFPIQGLKPYISIGIFGYDGQIKVSISKKIQIIKKILGAFSLTTSPTLLMDEIFDNQNDLTDFINIYPLLDNLINVDNGILILKNCTREELNERASIIKRNRGLLVGKKRKANYKKIRLINLKKKVKLEDETVPIPPAGFSELNPFSWLTFKECFENANLEIKPAKKQCGDSNKIIQELKDKNNNNANEIKPIIKKAERIKEVDLTLSGTVLRE